MDVEALRLKAAKRSVMLSNRGRTASRWVESFLQAEVAQVVGAEFIAQEAGELLVLFQKACFQ
jgi:hypothetical protein